MKNEIGRKLTSLTIMAIMFAGGMTVAVPSFMPEAAADFGATDGMLSVSSVYIQGAAILEVVVNDPNYSDVDNDIANGPTIEIEGTEYITNQANNGKWYVYAVDQSQSVLLDADSNGFEFGMQCSSGLGVETGTNEAGTGETGVANIIGDTTYTIWAEAIERAHTGATDGNAGECLDINNMKTTLDDTAGTTSRQLLSAAVLQNAPSLSNHNGESGNSTTVDLGQRGHSLNQSGYGSWPYILAFDFVSGDNEVSYGSDSIIVEYGNTADEAAIEVINNSPSDETHIYLTITDPALNIDPTTSDKWIFNLASPDSSDHQIFFANNLTDTGSWKNNQEISLAEMGDMGCSGNCRLANSTGSAAAIVDGLRNVIMVEDDVNSGVFESWASNGTSQLVTIDEVGADKKVVFTYGGNSADMIITYNDATLEFTTGSTGDWIATETATVTVTDADMNKYPGSSETLSIGDEDAIIPTIKMGTPLTLANSDGNNNLKAGAANADAGVQIGTDTGVTYYTLSVANTTDNSERLRIIHSAIGDTSERSDVVKGGVDNDHTWINVTTAHTVEDLVNLEGTSVLNYDISGPAGDLSSTAIAVYVLGTGYNTTGSADLDLVTSGNDRAGVVDLDDGTQRFVNSDVGDQVTIASSQGTALANADVNVGVSFKITHPVGTYLNATADYAIAADFCNFDQDNGSNVHNCIYRIEAEETGDNTGVYVGTVDYVMLNNSTSQDTDNGEADGNDYEVESLLTTNSDEVTVVLMNGVSGTDSVRVVYNDTDALQVANQNWCANRYSNPFGYSWSRCGRIWRCMTWQQ